MLPSEVHSCPFVYLLCGAGHSPCWLDPRNVERYPAWLEIGRVWPTGRPSVPSVLRDLGERTDEPRWRGCRCSGTHRAGCGGTCGRDFREPSDQVGRVGCALVQGEGTAKPRVQLCTGSRVAAKEHPPLPRPRSYTTLVTPAPSTAGGTTRAPQDRARTRQPIQARESEQGCKSPPSPRQSRRRWSDRRRR